MNPPAPRSWRPAAGKADPPSETHRGTSGRAFRRDLTAVLLLSVATRLAALPASHAGNMSPDAAHFLNVARCIARGEGFSNPAAWPAWLSPQRLPAPETFKDPGLPYAIAALTTLVPDPFLAGQLVSLLAGVALPVLVLLLGRRLTADPPLALLAGLMAAASPVLIAQSVRVMAESLFTLLVTAVFVAAASRASGRDAAGREARRGPRTAGPDLATGALLGLAFHVRAQAVLVIPAALLLLVAGRPAREGLARAARAGLALLAVVAPRLVRDLALFGVPLHSDASAYALWPLADPIEFSHGLTRPETSLAFALAHAPELASHTASSLALFFRSVLPRDILGHLLWTPALAAGIVLGLARWRRWAFAWVYLVPVVLAMSMVGWNTRYFASTAPLWCLLAAAGALWLARRAGAVRWPAGVRLLGVAALLALAWTQARRARQEIHAYRPPEIGAAIAEGPILASRTAPDEALMVVTTSYWSWFADRPSVHLVIADEPAFEAVARRYRVRWAALPTSRLAELAGRFPDGRLPRMLVPDHADSALDVTVFAVREAPSAPGGGGMGARPPAARPRGRRVLRIAGRPGAMRVRAATPRCDAGPLPA